MGEDRKGWEWGDGIVHVGGKDVTKAADGTRPGLKVCEGAVACLPASLNIVVDIKGVYMVEEGAILQ